MHCTNPECHCTRTKVEETRNIGEVVYRVRRCPDCGWRVTTKETYAPDDEQSIPDIHRKPQNYGIKNVNRANK